MRYILPLMLCCSVVNFNVLDQFFTDEKEKCPIILWQGFLGKNFLVKICNDSDNNFRSLISGHCIWGKYPKKYNSTSKWFNLKQHCNYHAWKGD